MSASIEEIITHYQADPSLLQRVAHRPVKPTLAISPSNPQWPQDFQSLKSLISTAIGPVAISITHVGSTSVPHLPAKAVIDIDVAIANPSDEETYVPQLEKAGFQFLLREKEWYEHRFFAMHTPYDCNLHIFKDGCAELARHVIMRDWLAANEGDRELYAATKTEAAEVSNGLGEDVMGYNARKEGVIRQILERAFRAMGYIK